jgi:hypothetical protein
MSVAGSDDFGAGTGWRVFISHTSELRDFPTERSYVAAVERAISACEHVIVNMADFPAADLPAAELCRERVRGCDVYVGVLGTRYGSPVRDMPEVSYTELEFETATEASLERLMFLLDTDATEVGIPLSRLIDHEFGARQEAFRRRVRDSGLVTQTFTDPATLGQLVERSLRELAERRRRSSITRRSDHTSRSAYLQQVRRIAPPDPPGLLGREAELAELAAFCLDPGQEPYLLWQAGAWAGKSALLSTFVLRPPPEVARRVRLVSFFITAQLAAQDTREAFTQVLLEQLAELTQRELPAMLPEAIREAYLLDLLAEAAVECQDAGRRLVLVVDGLDEDRGVTTGLGAHSIAALLPADPPAGMRLIVAGRPRPPIPDDVPGLHPLRDAGIVRPLLDSPYARDVERLSRQELGRLLHGTPLERDLLGLLTAARGGLSGSELEELTGAPRGEVEEILRTVAGRTFACRTSQRAPQASSEVYLLGHQELYTAAVRYLGHRLDSYRDRLDDWAKAFRSPVVPAGALIGRSSEMTLLTALIGELAWGQGSAVLIEGEPGIGKSALVRAAVAEAAGCQVFWGAGDELGQVLPLLPFLDGLRIREPSANPRRNTIVRLLRGEVAANRGADVPAALAEQLAALVAEECVMRPVIMVIDDLQWADSASITLWGRLARSARQMRLLLIGMMRPVPQRDDVLALRRVTGDATRLQLTRFTQAAVTDLVAALAGGRPDGNLLRLADGAAGNPLYLTELVAALARSSSLTITEAGAAELTSGSAPGSLSEAIADRLDFLTGPVRELVRAAAMLGADFAVPDLAIVVGRSVADLVPALEEAFVTGVLADSSHGIRFRSALIRTALYDEMPAMVRMAWHRDAGRALAEAGAPADQVARQLLLATDGPDNLAEPMDEWMLTWLADNADLLISQAPGVAADLLTRAVTSSQIGSARHARLAGRLADALRRIGDTKTSE